MQLEWPLVGRGKELEQVSGALLRDDVSGVVLFGPGGVGKTRIAAECLRLGERAGFATARAVATRASSAITLGALAPLLPDFGDRTFNLLGAAREAIAARAGDRPLMLFVDDGHLLDEVSASLLLQIAAERQVFVLVTVRSGEEVSDAITALWKDGHAERVDVAPLDETQTDELVHEVLDGPVDPVAAAELSRIASGNPLALRELLLATDEAGTLRNDSGIWRLTGSVEVSPRLVDLVTERLGHLSDDEHQVLELVALGEPLGLGMLEALAPAAAIESLERKGLLEVREDERRLEVWLAHPLHGEIVRVGMGALRTRAVLRSLADAVEGAGMRRRGDLLRVASWRLESGSAAATDMLVAAARQAFLVLDFELARRFAAAAWDAQATVEAGHLLGHVLCDLGRFDEAEAVLAETAPLVTDDRERVLVTMSRTENLYRMGRADEAVAVNETEEALVADPDWRAELAGHRATLVMLIGRPSEALEIVRPAIEGEAVRPLVEGAIAGGTVLTHDARPEDAIALHEKAYAAHLEIWEHELFQSEPGIQAIGIINGLLHAGRLGEAQALLDLAWQAAAESRTVVALGWFSLLYGNLTTVTGDMEAARSWYRTSSEHFLSTGQRGRARWALGGAALAAASLGRVDEGRADLAALDDLQTAPGFNEALIDDARAWVLAMGGDVGAARALLDRTADAALDGQRTCAAVVLHSLARLGDPAAAQGRIEAIAAEAQGRLIPARAAHVTALVRDDPEALLAVSTTFEHLGAVLVAAEAAADAARALRRADRSRDASAAAQRSRHLATRCPGVATPALALVDTVSPLTRREREVALLAAQAMTSKAIAETLFLSVRTVDNHLQRAYEKLGVSGRDELAGLVDQLGG